MGLRIVFELDERDLSRFSGMADQVKAAMSMRVDREQLIARVRANLHEARDEPRLPEFISERLKKLEILVDMVEDPDWKLGADDLKRVLGAMFYFAEPEDVIPDRTPVVGFLDDAVIVELTIRDFEPEVAAYEEFCGFRIAEKQRRENRGLSTDVSREDWLADKRAVLHHKMREQRAARDEAPAGWKVTLW